jgi:tetratricopeptide (TPR) repeat protein
LYEAAVNHFKEAENIAREIADACLVIECISHIGLISRRNDDFESAKECFTLAYETALKNGDQRAAEINYSLLGDLYCRLGQYDIAAPIFRKCLEISRKIGNGLGIRVNLGQLAESLIYLGQHTEAEELLSEVEFRCNQVHDGIGIAWTLKRKGQLLKARGKIQEGNELIQSGIQKLHEVGNEDYIADFERALGSTQLSLFNLPA